VILVDSRAGSQDLIKPLKSLGLPVEETTLEFGDVAFEGRGMGGAPLLIGIEHKRVSDVVQSLNDGRLAGHQMPGMLRTYDRCWLIVEGDWAHDSIGRVTVFKGKGERRPLKGAPPAIELEKRLITLETRGGFRVRHCATRKDAVRFIIALYRFWTDKDLDEHKSHLALHAPDLDRAMAIPVSDFRRIVAAVPGIGYRTSIAVEREFQGSFRRMMCATEKQWSEIKLRDDHGKEKRLGTARAKKIMEALS
jgi:ERCC4-type nuclease